MKRYIIIIEGKIKIQKRRQFLGKLQISSQKLSISQIKN